MNESYLAARREWSERYGGYIESRRRWRRVAVCALGVAAVSTVGVVVLATQSRIVPYVVEVDGRQRPLQVYAAEQLEGGTPVLVRAALARWVQDLRGVSSDATVQRAAVERVYAHLASGDPAQAAVSEWYEANPPFERAAETTVTVEVSQVLQVSRDTWRLEWVERPRTRGGQVRPRVWWTGTATVARGAVGEEMLILNPVGLFVREFDWSRDLRERSS